MTTDLYSLILLCSCHFFSLHSSCDYFGVRIRIPNLLLFNFFSFFPAFYSFSGLFHSRLCFILSRCLNTIVSSSSPVNFTLNHLGDGNFIEINCIPKGVIRWSNVDILSVGPLYIHLSAIHILTPVATS